MKNQYDRIGKLPRPNFDFDPVSVTARDQRTLKATAGRPGAPRRQVATSKSGLVYIFENKFWQIPPVSMDHSATQISEEAHGSM
eukprot:SAG22_NODE_952_length_6343_cov_3.567265_6_plen_84_part_00